jgi:hypothetical protein
MLLRQRALLRVRVHISFFTSFWVCQFLICILPCLQCACRRFLTLLHHSV